MKHETRIIPTACRECTHQAGQENPGNAEYQEWCVDCMHHYYRCIVPGHLVASLPKGRPGRLFPESDRVFCSVPMTGIRRFR